MKNAFGEGRRVNSDGQVHCLGLLCRGVPLPRSGGVFVGRLGQLECDGNECDPDIFPWPGFHGAADQCPCVYAAHSLSLSLCLSLFLSLLVFFFFFLLLNTEDLKIEFVGMVAAGGHRDGVLVCVFVTWTVRVCVPVHLTAGCSCCCCC